MVCTDTEIGLGLDSENNNIRISIISGAVEIKKSRKRIFIFFLICPNLESAGLRNYLSKNSGLRKVQLWKLISQSELCVETSSDGSTTISTPEISF